MRARPLTSTRERERKGAAHGIPSRQGTNNTALTTSQNPPSHQVCEEGRDSVQCSAVQQANLGSASHQPSLQAVPKPRSYPAPQIMLAFAHATTLPHDEIRRPAVLEIGTRRVVSTTGLGGSMGLMRGPGPGAYSCSLFKAYCPSHYCF